MKRSKGFSLIELMVVLAVVALLAAVAIPAYTGYIQRGKIAEATSNLSGLRVRMEQYFQDNRTYLNGANCGVAMPTAPEVQYFSFTSTPCAATQTTYTITATGIGSMAGFTYTINEQNAKTSTMIAPASPEWTGNATCWATKRDGTC